MSEAVTKLTVMADGAILATERFTGKMVQAGAAVDDATGGLAAYNAASERFRIAQEKGLAISTQTIARKSAEQRVYERAASAIDKEFALRLRLEREAERSALAFSNAVARGYLTQEQALTLLTQQQRQHAQQLSGYAAQNDNLTASIDRTTMAMRNNAAASRGGGSFHTTNLLFQAQDIAMMTMMGQAPMMLALQQGMQVGGIFHQIGNGKQIVQSLGGAIAGLLNPLNLATIAFIGLGAAGVQALMGMVGQTDDATTSLQRHKEWLDQILHGYDDAAAAADRALDRASRLPRGVVTIDLTATLEEQEAALIRFEQKLSGLISKIEQQRGHWSLSGGIASSIGAPDAGLETLIRQIDMMAQLGVNSSMTAIELDSVLVSLRELYFSSDNAALREIANDAYDIALELRNARLEADATIDSLRELKGISPIDIRLRMSREFDEAMEGMSALYMDPRSRFEIAREELDARNSAALAGSQTYEQMAFHASEYERVLNSINVAEAEWLKKQAEKGDNPDKQWKAANDNFQQRLAQQRLDIELLGQSTYEVTRQREAFDLLNQAKQAGIPITAGLTDQINLMSREYAANAVEMERQVALQRQIDEQINFSRGTFVGFFQDFRRSLMESTSVWEAFGNAAVGALDKIADRAMTMALNGIFDMILGAFMPTTGLVNGRQSTFNPGVGWMPNALGNVYQSPSLSAYSNGIYDSPQVFAFANGAGVFAEAGAEAIMPLRRGPSGRLGVEMYADHARRAANDNPPIFNLQIVNETGKPVQAENVSAQRNSSGGLDVKAVIKGTMKEAIADGSMDAVMGAVYGVNRRGR